MICCGISCKRRLSHGEAAWAAHGLSHPHVVLQHAAVGVLRRDHLLSTSRARQHSGRISQVTCFFVPGKVFTAHVFLCWYSFFSTVTLCKVVPGLICNMVAWSSREVSFCLFLYQVALQLVWKALVQSRAVSGAARASVAKPSPGCSSGSLVGTGLSRLIVTGR